MKINDYYKNIKKYIVGFLYSLPFGMKAADDEIFQQKSSSNSDDAGVYKKMLSRNLGEALRQGEINQEVEELRYKNYHVYRESNKYEYIGDGKARKVNKPNFNFEKFHIRQSNRYWGANIADSLNENLNDLGHRNEYTLKVNYHDIPRFRIEGFCKVFEFKREGTFLSFSAHFSTFVDSYEAKSKSFLNELKRASTVTSVSDIERNELLSNIDSIQFTTYKADGDNDMVSYTLHGLKFSNYEENKFEIVVTYSVDYFLREDLIDKYYSPTMDEKYKNKEKKINSHIKYNDVLTYYCSSCGNEIDKADYAITKADFGYPLCKKCILKLINSSNSI